MNTDKRKAIALLVYGDTYLPLEIRSDEKLIELINKGDDKGIEEYIYPVNPVKFRIEYIFSGNRYIIVKRPNGSEELINLEDQKIISF